MFLALPARRGSGDDLPRSRPSNVFDEIEMFRVLVDTCVWLDVAKDPRQYALLGVVEQMVGRSFSRSLCQQSPSTNSTATATGSQRGALEPLDTLQVSEGGGRQG